MEINKWKKWKCTSLYSLVILSASLSNEVASTGERGLLVSIE
jgi:hypothetical protein